MKREIKFRAFNKQDNKMYNDIGSTYDWEFMPTDTCENNEWILMQYTGLKDKNGKEIYEGDILQCYSVPSMFNWIVRYSKKNFGFVIVNIGVAGFLGDEFQINSEYFFEDRIVIGNIYENPNLLT